MNKRVEWIDYAKSIGIILVVYGHVARGLYSAGINIPEKFYFVVDSIIYSFHMPLFFFLAGLTFYCSYKDKGIKKFILSKVDTILYPYLLWSIVQGVIEVLLSNYLTGKVSYSEVFSLLWAPRAQFWFLYVLFFINCLFAIIYKMFSNKISIIVSCLSIVLYLFHGIMPYSFITSMISQYSVYFSIGIFFSFLKKTDVIKKNSSIRIISVAFILSHRFYQLYISPRGSSNIIIPLVIAILSIFFVITMSMTISKTSVNTLLYIGKSSMIIYLLHTLTGSGIRVILHKILGINIWSVHLIVGFFGGIAVPLIAFEIINKLKIPYILSSNISKILIKKKDELPSPSMAQAKIGCGQEKTGT